MDENAANERVRQVFTRDAPRYDQGMRFMDRLLGFELGRAWLAERIRGETLEIGIGTGLNLPHYPPGVRLTGVDLTPAMLDQARERARSLGLEVDLQIGDAQALDFPDERFDTVMFALTLCSVPDDRRAVAEAARVLKRGGRLLLMEHVRSPVAPVRAVQRLIAPIMARFQADHILREPLQLVRAEGFQIEELERSKWGIVERVMAHKPG